ncbi:amino acid adenylation domain-containing protein, partial [Pseudomonas farsensis]
RGYHRRPGLTAERFATSPFGRGERLYRTGDLARQRADGVIEYAGRIDHQVKIRGLRIELGEIEARLMEQPQVREAVVLAVELAGSLQLVAYVVASQADADPQALREQLQGALRRVLPEYMVPVHMLWLEQMPLSPNGKLERRALPLPGADLGQKQAHVAPQGELEQQLAAIWQDVLKRESVGATDNFFELGGDSIISIQVVSRARLAGIRFTPKQLFQHQTVRGLASVAESTERTTPLLHAPAMGETPLLPFQQVFFDTVDQQRQHWNQSLSLRLREPLAVSVVERALLELINHHDALRLRFNDTEGGWRARFAEPQSTLAGELEVLQVADAVGLERFADTAHASLDLGSGPLFKALLANLDDGSQRLILIAHHLVVDGVSWRILLEDLQSLCTGQPAALPARTSSIKDWAERLQAYACSESQDQEYLRWQERLAGAPRTLPGAREGASLRNRDASHACSRLDTELTRRLLQEAPAAYRTRINDLLLTALARVINRWSGDQRVLLQLEGHGREDVFEGFDLSRTVGWFTTLYPVQLSVVEDIADSIKSVKEQLRAVADHGLGYSALRYLGQASVRKSLAALAQPRITFNYLGQFDTAMGIADGLFQLSGEPAGQQQSDAAPLANWLSLSGQVYNGVLSFDWVFSNGMFDQEVIEHLAAEYAAELARVVEHCCQAGNAGATPSDFPLAGLSQRQLDDLPLALADVEDLFSLSPMQQGMLFHALYEADAGHYINQLRVDIDGLDVERFRNAWQAALQRHEMLRSGFIWPDGHDQPLQFVQRQAQLAFEVIDWRKQADMPCALDSRALAEREAGFDLGRAPLLRLWLGRTQEDRYHLIYTHHHILMDGWSSSQLLGEVLQHYAGVPQQSQGVRYSDYIAWLQAQDPAASRAFWQSQLAQLSAPTRLAQTLPCTATGNGHGEYLQAFEPARTQALNEFARHHKVTVNTVLQATWALLLQRYGGQDCVVFGATVAGRPVELKGIDQQIGLFINTLPVITRPQPEQSVGDWLQAVQLQNLALREHEHTPLFEIQRWAGQGGDALFDNILVFESYPVSEALQQGAPDGLRFGELSNHEQSNYPLMLMINLGESLSLHYRHDMAHFAPARIEQLACHFDTLLGNLMVAADQPLGNLQILDRSEQQLQLACSTATTRDWPRHLCIHQMITAQALERPQATALVFGELQLSYAELESQANALAHRLLDLGVGAGARVGIALKRGPDMIVALLAVLKVGSAYVPLDPDYPLDRLAYMMQDSGMDLLLSQADLLGRLPVPDGVGRLDVTDRSQWLDKYPVSAPQIQVSGEDLAYIIYTSGSTGKPKGVMVRHAGLGNFVSSLCREPGFSADSRVLSLTTFSFDIFGLEVYAPLARGGAVVLIDETTLHDSDALLALIAGSGVNVVQATPSSWRMLLDNPRHTALANCTLLCGGEALAQDLAARMLALGGPLWNLYGPTETTIWSAAHRLTVQAPTPWLGRAIDNTGLYILGDELLSGPAGATGELLIGGEGLARGYWQRPSLTAERFVPDPFGSNGARLYRTGDLARYRDDGVIEYLGRIDHQVKIRGHRIELGEIEARLLQLPEVREASVLAADGRLVGYLVLDPAACASIEAIADQLHGQLPDYMVPTQWLTLERMPLTPNGKLDRKALPVAQKQGKHSYRPAQTPLQAQVVQVWQEVLGVTQVGLDDDFFALGGHSLLATQAVSRLRHVLNREVALRTLFEYPLLERFVEQLHDGNPITRPPLSKLDPSQPLALSYAQERQWFLWQLDPQSAAYHIPSALRLRGQVNREALQASLNAVVARHDSLRTHFVEDAGKVQVQIESGATTALEWVVSSGTPEQADAEVAAFIQARAGLLFDLRKGPLLRASVLQLGEQDHLLLLVQHHIIADGWSVQVLIDEMVECYRGFSTGVPAKLPALAVGYADYAVWQRQWLEQGERQRQLEYWCRQLAGELPVLQLPADRARPAQPSYQGARLELQLPAQLGSDLVQLARSHGTTLNMLLLSSLQALLYRYSGQADVRVGVPVANRGQLETERVIGLFANTQVIRAHVSATDSFAALLEQTRFTVLEAQAHQDLPFEQLVEALQPERNLGISPLFQVLHNHQSAARAGRAGHDVAGLHVEGVMQQQAAQFDLTLETYAADEGLWAAFIYATDLFDAATVERMAAHWQRLLGAIVADPAQRIGDLPMLAADETRQLLDGFNATATEYPLDTPVQRLIEAQVQRTPQAEALVFGDVRLSYAELDARANQLA